MGVFYIPPPLTHELIIAVTNCKFSRQKGILDAELKLISSIQPFPSSLSDKNLVLCRDGLFKDKARIKNNEFINCR
ncbi:hypothetical protein NCCP133_29370 [Cytobacillus sp. NCCP-133]|nr:hypothetical protein NCCP133_29370 [Cytobacillus sp. NCCP-133]